MRSIASFLVSLWHALVVVPALLMLADRDRRGGRLVRAKARYLRSVALDPASFRAHFGLGCVFLQQREFSRAEREFMLAEEISPARYREHRARMPDFRRDAPPPQRPGLPRRSGHPPAMADPRPAREFWGNDDVTNGLGDCVDVDEWARFQRMGPITTDELIVADVDRAIRALYREPHE